ncbi:MAG: amino acid ABC transporter permease [Alphaproteobacteria bacterium]|nr:amino acid ABC transporter permease [Alphaproteobacteria bacterium]
MSVETQDVESDGAKVPLWNDPKVRALVSQAVLIGLVLWFGYEIVNNTFVNLEKRKIASGFGFLNTTASFGIIQTLVPYTEASSYGRVFFVGLLNTLLIGGIGIVVATMLGFLVGIMRLSKNWVVQKVATVYVETLRNIPLLLQIFFWYFGVLSALPNARNSLVLFGETVFLNSRGLYLPKPIFEDGSGAIWIALLVGIVAAFFVRRWATKRQEATGEQFPKFWATVGLVLGLPFLAYLLSGLPVSVEYSTKGTFNLSGGLQVIPEFVALLLALSFYTASFIAEIVRAGILAVSHGQTEAAHALGIKNSHTLRLVVIPQALRVIIPPLTSQYLNLTKNSSLAVAIAYPDLVSVFAGTVLNQTGQAVEILLMTMGVYLAISLITSMFMNWYNAKMALAER